ncbi:hypothetical protein FACS1894214_3430 [Planctomycetales bacterium]|nr:hypothetical protein FACS1894214_3430 [Planctomycetales bacterium]
MEKVNKEILLDYLLSELETDEIRSVDKELLRTPSLRKDLAEIQQILGKVSLLNEEIEPPAGLKQKTVDRVFAATGSEILLLEEDSPAVPDEVVIFPLIKTEEYAENRSLPSSHSRRLSRRIVPFVRHNASLLNKPEIAKQNTKHISKRRYAELSISVAAGVLLALFIFTTIRFTGSQIQTYITQSKIHKINKNLNVYSQLAGSNAFQHSQSAENPAENVVHPVEPAHADLAAANWQEVIPAKVPLLNVGSNSNISVLPLDNERILPDTLLPNSHPSPVYLVSSPVFQDTVTDISHTSTLAAHNPPILLRGQMPEKVEQVELSHRDLDYQMLMSKINGAVSLMDGNKQSNPTVQTVTGQNVLLQNGKVFFRELPVFLPQNR